MHKSKKFFFICVAISVLIVTSNLFYKFWQLQKLTSAPRSSFDYAEPTRRLKMPNISDDMTGCQLPVTDVELSFTAHIVLATKYLTSPLNRQTMLEAAQAQSKFLFGYFNLNKRPGQTPLFLSNKEIKIQKLSSKKSAYPIDLTMRNTWNEESDHPYMRNSLKNPVVYKNEPAVIIQYTATVNAKACGEVKEKKIDIIFPKDPFLAYWAIPDKDFSIASYQGSHDRLNPCSNEELVKIKQTNWFWYTWAPSSEKCLSVINHSPFYDRVVAKVSTRNDRHQVKSNFFPDQDHYEISLIFGTLYNQSILETIQFLKENLSDKTLFTLNSKLQKSNQTTALSETTLEALGFFLKELPNLMTVKDVKIEWLDKQSMQIIILAKLDNGKSLTLNLYYGITSIDYIQSDTFLRFVINSLTTSDFIFYTGHAGGGHNFSLPYWSEKSGISLNDIQKKISTKKFQGFVIVSCYSNSYFGEDIISARSDKNLSTLIARSAAQEYIFHTSLGLLNFLRQPNLNDQSFKSFIEPVDLGKTVMINFYGDKITSAQ